MARFGGKIRLNDYPYENSDTELIPFIQIKVNSKDKEKSETENNSEVSKKDVSDLISEEMDDKIRSYQIEYEMSKLNHSNQQTPSNLNGPENPTKTGNACNGNGHENQNGPENLQTLGNALNKPENLQTLNNVVNRSENLHTFGNALNNSDNISIESLSLINSNDQNPIRFVIELCNETPEICDDPSIISLQKKIPTDLAEGKAIFSKKFIEDTANNDQAFLQNKRMILFKTEMCRSFTECGQCKYNDSCQFCHDPRELRIVERHPKYKTEYCKTFWNEGSCPYGNRCCFIHEGSNLKKNGSKINLESEIEFNLINEDDLMIRCASNETKGMSLYDQDQINAVSLLQSRFVPVPRNGALRKAKRIEKFKKETPFKKTEDLPKPTFSLVLQKNEAEERYENLFGSPFDKFIENRFLEIPKFESKKDNFTFTPENSEEIERTCLYNEKYSGVWCDEPMFFISKSKASRLNKM